MVVLESVIVEARSELNTMLNDVSDERRTEALRLALFKISQLETHTRKSRRILNDLGLIRSLLARADNLRLVDLNVRRPFELFARVVQCFDLDFVRTRRREKRLES